MRDKSSAGLSFSWGHSRPFNDFPDYLKKRFGTRVQKLSIDAGFTCPNRDGVVGTGGCTFCSNKAFTPGYCTPQKTVTEQLTKGMAFFSRKYPATRYLAYFQAYTNTYAPLAQLRSLYEEALSVPGVVGIVIGTRPDCVTDDILVYLETLAKRVYVSVEYGIESTSDKTLARVNRGHDFADTVEAVRATSGRGIQTGGHLILGLPGESPGDMLGHAFALNLLPLDIIKIHQLQLIQGTPMADEYASKPDDFTLFTPESYRDLLIRFLEVLRPSMVVERFASVSSPGLLVSRRWGLKNYQLVNLVEKEMARRRTWQGRLFSE